MHIQRNRETWNNCQRYLSTVSLAQRSRIKLSREHLLYINPLLTLEPEDMDFLNISLSLSQNSWIVVVVALVSYLCIEILCIILMIFLCSLSISSSNKQRHVGYTGSSFCSWLSHHTWHVSIFPMLVVLSWQQWRCSVFSGWLSPPPSLSTESLPGTPWPNIPDRYFVNSPNFTLHISPSMESSISTIMNCTINTAMLSESVSRTYSIDLTVLSSFCRSQRTIYSRCWEYISSHGL